MTVRPLLEVVGLTVTYGGVTAVSELHLAVPPGAVVALLGPNGAGKTSTLRALSGLVAPARGRVWIEGREVTGLAPSEIARLGVGHVPEGRGVFAGLSVRDNLRLTRPGPDDPIIGALELFPELTDRLEQRAGTLSGGQQQMVALARALVGRPRLLLLDEISTGLAPLVVRRLLEVVAAAAEAGAGVLLVEQYVEAALGMADYTYVMESGRLTDAGEAAEIRDSGLLASYLGPV